MKKKKVRGGNVENRFLRLISGNHVLLLNPIKGEEPEEVFRFIDGGSVECFNEKGGVYLKTPVEVYDIKSRGTFSDFLRSLDQDMEKLFFEPAQIKNFVLRHPNWLKKRAGATFFAYKSKGEYRVALVGFMFDGSLEMGTYEFDDMEVWDAGQRFVVPRNNSISTP